MDEDDLDRISQAIGRMRVMIGRRVLGRLALANVAPTLDLSDLDVLGSVPGKVLRSGETEGAPAASVGGIARRLRIDPSRASRLVAALVDAGYLQREVAQEDGRRAVLRRSDSGDRIFAEIQRVKHDSIRQITSSWSAGEVAGFARALDLFTREWDAITGTADAPDLPPRQR